MKTKLLLMAALIFGVAYSHAQSNSITVTSTLPTTVEIGESVTVTYEYTLAANATDQQIKIGFNEVNSSGGYVGNGDAAYSGGLGIGATTGTVSGSMTFTVTKPESASLAAGNKYVYDISIQENGGSYQTYASATESGTEITVNPASGVINAISVTNTLPTTAAQGEMFDVNLDYSANQEAIIQVGICSQGSSDNSSEWGDFAWLKDYYVNIPAATTGTEQTTVTIEVPTNAALSSTFTGYKRYRILINLLDPSYNTIATANTVIDPFTITAALNTTDANANGIAIYPNPVSSSLNINPQLLQANTIWIHDLMGRTVSLLKNTKSLTSVDVSQLSSGIYILKTDNKKQFKFIKQ